MHYAVYKACMLANSAACLLCICTERPMPSASYGLHSSANAALIFLPSSYHATCCAAAELRWPSEDLCIKSFLNVLLAWTVAHHWCGGFAGLGGWSGILWLGLLARRFGTSARAPRPSSSQLRDCKVRFWRLQCWQQSFDLVGLLSLVMTASADELFLYQQPNPIQGPQNLV